MGSSASATVEASNTHKTVKISQIYVYPIKSCQGASLKITGYSIKGLRHDRCWKFVNDCGETMTQRKYPFMTLIRTKLTDTDLQVFINDSWHSDSLDKGEYSNICRAMLQAYGVKCTLERTEDKPAFDSHPYFIINSSSLPIIEQCLPNRTRLQIIQQMRPNLVIDCDDAWIENSWNNMWIGDLKFSVVQNKWKEGCLKVASNINGKIQTEPSHTIRTKLDGFFGIKLSPVREQSCDTSVSMKVSIDHPVKVC